MNVSLRILTSLVALAAGYAALEAAPQRWKQPLGLTNRDAGMVKEVLPPSPRQEVMQARVLAKAAIVKRLLDQELTLIEAAAYFRDLNAHPAEHRETSWKTIEGATDEERLCRQVIRWVDVQYQSEARYLAGKNVVAAFEAELATRVANGRIELPEM